MLLGDAGTGKSSLVLRFVKGQFVEFQVGYMLKLESLTGSLVFWYGNSGPYFGVSIL